LERRPKRVSASKGATPSWVQVGRDHVHRHEWTQAMRGLGIAHDRACADIIEF